MSVNIRVRARDRNIRASGVVASGVRDWWKTASLPGPETSTHTCRAAAMAA
jgi:hypothetical protein